jgi:hypothetical protein
MTFSLVILFLNHLFFQEFFYKFVETVGVDNPVKLSVVVGNKTNLSNAAALILVHQHPSGDPSPSSEDIAITRRLMDAGEIMGIKVLDHIIVGAGEYLSFAERGLL